MGGAPSCVKDCSSLHSPKINDGRVYMKFDYPVVITPENDPWEESKEDPGINESLPVVKQKLEDGLQFKFELLSPEATDALKLQEGSEAHDFSVERNKRQQIPLVQSPTQDRRKLFNEMDEDVQIKEDVHKLLHEAIRQGDLDKVIVIASCFDCAIVRFQNSLTPLHIAVLHHQLPILRYFIETLRMKRTAVDVSLRTPLDWAKLCGNRSIIEYLEGDTDESSETVWNEQSRININASPHSLQFSTDGEYSPVNIEIDLKSHNNNMEYSPLLPEETMRQESSTRKHEKTDDQTDAVAPKKTGITRRLRKAATQMLKVVAPTQTNLPRKKT